MANKSYFRPLKNPKDFDSLKRTGLRVKMAHWGLVSYSENNQSFGRFGFTVPKYVGPAVIRNKLKRWGREFFRALSTDFGSVDINVVFLKRTSDFYKQLPKREFDDALSKALRRVGHGF